MDFYGSLQGNSTTVYSDALHIFNDVDRDLSRSEFFHDQLKLAKFDDFDIQSLFEQDCQLGIAADSNIAILTCGLLSGSTTNELVHNQQQHINTTPFEFLYSDVESLASPPATAASPASSASSLSSCEDFYNLEEFLQDSPLSSPRSGRSGSGSSADSFSIDQFLMGQSELPVEMYQGDAFPGIADLLLVAAAGMTSQLSCDGSMSSESSVVPESPQFDAQSPASYIGTTPPPSIPTYIQQVSAEVDVGTSPSFGDLSTIDFSVFECDAEMSEQGVGDLISIGSLSASSIIVPLATPKYVPILPKKSLGRKSRRSEPYPTACSAAGSLVVSVGASGEVLSKPQVMAVEPPQKKVKTSEQKLRKKGQNRDAAIRYRQKKKTEVDVVTSEADDLEERNRSLRGSVGSLRKEIEYLKQLMLDVITARLRSRDGDASHDEVSHDDCTEAAIQALQKHA